MPQSFVNQTQPDPIPSPTSPVRTPMYQYLITGALGRNFVLLTQPTLQALREYLQCHFGTFDFLFLQRRSIVSDLTASPIELHLLLMWFCWNQRNLWYSISNTLNPHNPRAYDGSKCALPDSWLLFYSTRTYSFIDSVVRNTSWTRCALCWPRRTSWSPHVDFAAFLLADPILTLTHPTKIPKTRKPGPGFSGKTCWSGAHADHQQKDQSQTLGVWRLSGV